MEAEEEIFFSDDEDLINDGLEEREEVVKVPESLRSEATDKQEEKTVQTIQQDKVLAIESESVPGKTDHPLSLCFSRGARCANCVSKLTYTPSC